MGIIRRLRHPMIRRQLPPQEERRSASESRAVELWPPERINKALGDPPSPKADNAALITDPQHAIIYVLSRFARRDQ